LAYDSRRSRARRKNPSSEGLFVLEGDMIDAALEYAARGWSQKRGCGFKAHQLRHRRGVAFISRDALRGQLKPLGARR